MDCLYDDEELIGLKEGENPPGTIIAQGITFSVGFHPGRLESHVGEIRELLAQLPDEFMYDGPDGGTTFLNAHVRKDGFHWGGHPQMQELMLLGLATKKIAYCMPRDLWSALPGGLPYFMVKLDGFVPGEPIAAIPDMPTG